MKFKPTYRMLPPFSGIVLYRILQDIYLSQYKQSIHGIHGHHKQVIITLVNTFIYSLSTYYYLSNRNLNSLRIMRVFKCLLLLNYIIYWKIHIIFY